MWQRTIDPMAALGRNGDSDGLTFVFTVEVSPAYLIYLAY
jgi:hypothetical protein